MPEIVAQMEQTQDTVIRVSYKNVLLISGPAGSGKTTLALHRVAYLFQSPDASDRFNAHKILILVQDQSTKDYFSHLLPELGIRNINIQTFSQWAISVLGLNYNYKYRIGITEKAKDEFEFFKLSVLNNLPRISYQDDVIKLLDKLYDDLPINLRDLFTKKITKF